MVLRRCCLVCAVLFLPVAARAMTADDVIRKTGVSGGLCSFPRATAADEKLILELAGRPNMVVHAMAGDEKIVSRLREAGEAAGLLGRSLYVETGDAAKLPFADRLVDLLVVTDLAEKDITPELRAEWLRALAPRRGSALVGEKVLRGELPAGSDPWTHRCHGADNAQVSADTALKVPFMTQWWAAPRMEGFWGTTVVSGNGRMFTIRGSRHFREEVFLTARSLTNGLVLWQQRLRPAPEAEKIPHGGYVPGRSCVVVDGDSLYLVEKDSVLCLNAETGQELDRVAGPRPGGSVKWIACAEGILAVLSGEADVMKPISYQTVAANPVGRDLAVYDSRSKKELWRDALPGDVDERAIAVREGRLFYLAQDAGVFCRELTTGKEIWKNPDAGILAGYRTQDQKAIGQLLVSQPALMALADVVLLRAPWAKEVVALSRQDGSVLWKKPAEGMFGGLSRGLAPVAVQGLWVAKDGAFDLKTGKPATGPRFVGSGCGPTTATPDYLVTPFGLVADMKTGKVIRPADLKSPCDVGSLVSEGVMVTVPSECGCSFEVKCYRALASAGGVKLHEAPPWNERMLEADKGEPAAMPLTDADWPTCRHDPQRSGTTAAKVGDAAKVLWQWKPNGAVPYKDTWAPTSGPRLAPDFLATAPVAAGGFVYFASHDGTVRCLKAADGKDVWKFPTGAMCFAPPTIWEGRALVGGGDGRVYCLDATTGRLLWKAQAAPRERRLFWMGHLISTWPVTGGVVVQDGVGCAVAGLAAENGVHAAAFDPRTGKALWTRDDAGAAGMVNGGATAVFDGRLHLAGMSAGSYDLKTGEAKASRGSVFGCEVGVLANRWVVIGGRRLTESEADIASPISSGFTMKVPGTTSLPASDAELVLLAPGGSAGSMLAVPTDKFVAWQERKIPPAPAPPGGKPKPVDVTDLKAWSSFPGIPASCALTADMALAALIDPRSGRCQLTAFRRADGSQAWSVELPDQPARNRLAVDRDGRVLVSLCDGSVICVGR